MENSKSTLRNNLTGHQREKGRNAYKEMWVVQIQYIFHKTAFYAWRVSQCKTWPWV
ncbi:unnamed protein product [Lathyrus sativus]|nr:unnamed protein product [Lathyrus sativus]